MTKVYTEIYLDKGLGPSEEGMITAILKETSPYIVSSVILGL